MKRRLFFYLMLMFSFVITTYFFSCKTKFEFSGEYEDYMFVDETGEKSCFIMLDSVNSFYAEGKLYFVDDELTMDPEPFTANLYRNNCFVKLSDSIVYVLKIKRWRGDRYEGSYTSGSFSGRRKFVVYPHLSDEYLLYECDRYKKSMFKIERIHDVRFAKVKGFWSSIPDDTIHLSNIVRAGLFNSLMKNDLNLAMDIYLPKGDTLPQRPLMMFVHGGAFFIGDKASLPYRKWCEHFASLGYVCASINYRMGFRINAKSIERTAYQATQDAHAAMRYLISKKDIYRIDPDLLFVVGSSAGAVTAMNITYMRNENRPKSSYSSLLHEDLGDIEMSGNNIRNEFKIKAVANMWGVVYDLDILKNSTAPIISFHGDKDGVLPYKSGLPFETIGEFRKVLFSKVYGSYCIHEKARELGIHSVLHTFEGQGHALHLDKDRKINENFYTIQNEIVDFFYDELSANPVYIVQDEFDKLLFTIDTTDVLVSNWDVVGGIAIEESKGKIRASWFDDELNHELKVSGLYTNGAVFEDVFVLKNVELNEDNTY